MAARGAHAWKRLLSFCSSTISTQSPSAAGWASALSSKVACKASWQPSRYYGSKKNYVPEVIDYSRIVPGYEDVVKDVRDEDNVVPKLYSLEYANMMTKHKCDIKDVVDLMKNREGDTGSSAVQIGTLSVRIKYLTNHMRENRKDKHCLRSLLRLIHRRQKVMRYLKRKDSLLYHKVISDLDVRPIMDKKYL